MEWTGCVSAHEHAMLLLAGLARGQLFVIPGWRYRLLTAFPFQASQQAPRRVELLTGRSRPEMRSGSRETQPKSVVQKVAKAPASRE